MLRTSVILMIKYFGHLIWALPGNAWVSSGDLQRVPKLFSEDITQSPIIIATCSHATPESQLPDSLSSRPIVYPGLGVGRWFVPFCELLLDLKNADKDFPNH